MRQILEAKIAHLKSDILILGEMVEHATTKSVDAFQARNTDQSQQVIEEDKAINTKRGLIEQDIMVAIATEQPVAQDLRLLASMFEVISELERMGDYAKGIAAINLRMVEPLKPASDIPYMAQQCLKMLRSALTAFIEEDTETAHEILQQDDEIDALYEQIYRLLITYVLESESNIERACQVLWVAHNLERFADRVTTICKRTIFVTTGNYEESRLPNFFMRA